MDDDETPDNPWPWAPPDTAPAESPVRAAGFCVCAWCRQAGVCADFTRHEGRFVHTGECHDNLRNPRRGAPRRAGR